MSNMLNFKKIELSDKQWVDSLLKLSDYRATEFCFTSMFIWADIFKSEIARYGDFVLLRSLVDDTIEYIEKNELPKGNPALDSGKRKAYYVLPSGRGNLLDVLPLLVEDAKSLDREFRLTAIPPALIPEMETAFPEMFEFHQARDTFDYIYDTERFTNLPGTKLQARRNQISVFKRSNNWTYESICSKDEKCQKQIQECMEMTKEWCRIKDCENNISMWHERNAVLIALENFKELGLIGGIIRVNEEVVAYTIGEPINSDTFIIHIEKAFTAYRGAYPTIAREFLSHEVADYKYINREDDAGDDGLRKAKLSYQPVFFEEKYFACLK